MEPRVTLITLGVIDLERAIRFYRDGLGWEKASAGDKDVAFFQIGGGGLVAGGGGGLGGAGGAVLGGGGRGRGGGWVGVGGLRESEGGGAAGACGGAPRGGGGPGRPPPQGGPRGGGGWQWEAHTSTPHPPV